APEPVAEPLPEPEPEPVPEPVVAQPVVAQPAPVLPEPRPAEEKRRKFPLVPIAIVLLVLAVGVGSFLLWPKGGNQNNASNNPPASGTSTPAATSQSQTPTQQQTTDTPPPQTNSQTSPQNPPNQTPQPPAGPKNATEAITAYYALIPGDLQTGWSLLTDQFKAGRGLTFEGYQRFWRDYTSVQLSNFVPQGENAVTVTLQYMQGSNVVMTETPTFTFVQQNGKWLINSQG
ncbi:MAG TPA: hypothetical protein VF821_26765, partial [Lentzea sp.]